MKTKKKTGAKAVRYMLGAVLSATALVVCGYALSMNSGLVSANALEPEPTSIVTTTGQTITTEDVEVVVDETTGQEVVIDAQTGEVRTDVAVSEVKMAVAQDVAKQKAYEQAKAGNGGTQDTGIIGTIFTGIQNAGSAVTGIFEGSTQASSPASVKSTDTSNAKTGNEVTKASATSTPAKGSSGSSNSNSTVSASTNSAKSTSVSSDNASPATETVTESPQASATAGSRAVNNSSSTAAPKASASSSSSASSTPAPKASTSSTPTPQPNASASAASSTSVQSSSPSSSSSSAVASSPSAATNTGTSNTTNKSTTVTTTPKTDSNKSSSSSTSSSTERWDPFASGSSWGTKSPTSQGQTVGNIASSQTPSTSASGSGSDGYGTGGNSCSHGHSTYQSLGESGAAHYCPECAKSWDKDYTGNGMTKNEEDGTWSKTETQ